MKCNEPPKRPVQEVDESVPATLDDWILRWCEDESGDFVVELDENALDELGDLPSIDDDDETLARKIAVLAQVRRDDLRPGEAVPIRRGSQELAMYSHRWREANSSSAPRRRLPWLLRSCRRIRPDFRRVRRSQQQGRRSASRGSPAQLDKGSADDDIDHGRVPSGCGDE
jgi:hypothetical protein